MCHPAVFYVAMAAAAAVSAKAQVDQGRYEKKVGEYNAAVSENKAKDVKNKAAVLESEARQKAMALRSRQRSIAASRGAEVDFGTALSIQEDTEMIGEINAMRIRQAGEDEASALMEQAALQRSAGKQAARQGRLGAFSTLLGAVGSIGGAASGTGSAAGAGKVSPKWYASSNYSLMGDMDTSFLNSAPAGG